MSTTNSSNLLILDEHTAKFFPQKYHEGKVEARFYLGIPGTRGRVFAGRLARRLNSQWVAVLQEQHPAREESLVPGELCLVLEPYVPLLRARRKKFWESQLEEKTSFLDCVTMPPNKTDGLTLNTLILWRYYFDEASGLGVRLPMNAGEGGYLVDLKPSAQRGGDVHKWFQTWDYDISGLRWKTFGEMFSIGKQDFRHRMNEVLYDPNGEFHHLMLFYGQNEETRCRAALNWTTATRELSQKMFQFAALEEVKEGGELEGYTRVCWRPWIDLGLQVDPVFNGCAGIDIPNGLKVRWAAICSQLGCNLPFPSKWCEISAPLSPDPWMQSVKRDWAHDFKCKITVASAHERAFLMNDLAKEIDAMKAAIAATVVADDMGLGAGTATNE